MATEHDTIIERVKVETVGAGSAREMASALDKIATGIRGLDRTRADGAARSLATLADGIKAVQQAEERLSEKRRARASGQHRDAAGRFAARPAEAGQASASVSRLGDASAMAGGFLQGFSKGLVGGMKALAAAEVAFLTAGAGLAMIAKTQVLDPVAHRQSLEGAAGKLLGKGGNGADAVRQSMMLANELGADLFETSDQVVALLGRGFKMDGANNALDVMKGMADLKIISPSVRTENLVTAIAQIKSKGKLQMEELQGQIGEAFDVSAVLSVIGKKIGKTNDEVRKMISAGRIDADTGIAGVLGAIQEKTGQGLGEAARESSMSLGGLMTRLEQYPSTVKALMNVDTGGIQRTFRTIWDAIDPESQGGKDLIGAVSRIGQGIVNIFADVDAGDVNSFVANVTGFLDQVGKQIKTWGPVVRQAFGGFATGFTAGLQALERFFGNKDMTESAKSWGEALGFVGTALGTILGVGVAVGAGFFSLVATVVSGLAGLPGAAYRAGVSLVDGLAQGILSAPGKVAEAASSLGSSAINALKGAIKSRSPSKLTFDVGAGGFGEGFVGGIQATNDNARDAGGGLGAAAAGGLSQGARPFALAQGAGSQGRGAVSFDMSGMTPSFSFPGITDPKQAGEAGELAADRFARQFAAKMREIVEAA